MYTLYEGKPWLDGRKPGDEQKLKGGKLPMGKSLDTGTFIESQLDTVAEESEEEFKRLSSHKEMTIDGEKGSLEEEVLCVLIYLLVEFLSTGTEPKEDGENKEVVKKDVSDIIEYLEMEV